MSLYTILTRLIERGQTDGLQEKLDVFFAVGKLTEKQYRELSGLPETEELDREQI